jgi:hypothetical protein
LQPRLRWSLARSRTVSARLLAHALPNTLRESALSPNYRQPTSVAHGRTTARTGFEKQRLCTFSRRGPSFWPLDRCQAQPDLLLIGDPPLLIGDGVIARRSTTDHTGSSRCAAETHKVA